MTDKKTRYSPEVRAALAELIAEADAEYAAKKAMQRKPFDDLIDAIGNDIKPLISALDRLANRIGKAAISGFQAIKKFRGAA